MSLDILDEIDKLFNLPNFHVLLGNHELSQILGEDIFHYESNQVKDFEEHVMDRHEWFDEQFMYSTAYKESMKRWSWGAKTHNGIFIMHSGPHDISMQELKEKGNTIETIDTSYAFSRNKFALKTIENFIWARPWDDYTPSLIDEFLATVNCHTMIVGHTVARLGYGIFDKQIILSSSYGGDRKKCYIDIPLNADIKNVDDVAKYIQVLRGKFI